MKPMFPRLSRIWTPYARRSTASALFCAFSLVAFSDEAPAETDRRVFDAPTLQAVTNLARAMSASSPASVEDNVAAILALLQSSFVYTLPQWSRQVSTPISAGIANGLFASGYSARTVPSTEDSYLYKILAQLQDDADLQEIADYLRSIESNTDIDLKLADILEQVESMGSYMDAVQGHLNNIDYANSANTYGNGMWGAHLDDAQMAELRLKLDDLLEASDQGFDLLNTASGETRLEVKEALDRQYESLTRMIDYLNDLTEPVQTAASNTTEQVVSAEKQLTELERVSQGMRGITNAIEVGPTANALTDGSDATDYLYSPTNHAELDKLKIEQPDISGIERLTQAIDPADFDVAPSFTGADATITMLRSGTADLDEDVVIDLALPSNVERGISTFAVWLWRILFVCSVWYLVKEEFGFWATLGGSN